MTYLALKLLQEPAVGDSVLEFLGLISLLAFFAGAWRHIECQRDGCHRWGRFPHGHYKLCRVHHPAVPDDGRITGEHIQAITQNQTKEKP